MQYSELYVARKAILKVITRHVIFFERLWNYERYS